MDKPKRRCADCGVLAPATETEDGSTLLTVKYGWRLRRGTDAQGVRRIEARCPECYNRMRKSSPDIQGPARPQSMPTAPPSRPALDGDGELVLAFPGNVVRAQVQEPTRVQSTFISISQASLVRMGLFDKYLSFVPGTFQEKLRSRTFGEWSPIDLAMAHYEACDRLGLSEPDIIKASRDIGVDLQEAVLRVVANGGQARPVLDPWTILGHAHRALAVCTDGAGMALFKLGACDARMEIAGFPFARISYVRVALRGALHSVLQRCATSVYTTDIPRLATARIVAYRISWH